MSDATSNGPSRPDPAATLGRLKPFQRDAVEHAFERLFTAPDSTRRFLVADEVGLGKTLIAGGIVARAVDHLWESVPRIDIVYVCSNQVIARQNLKRLGQGEPIPVDRISLLPVNAGELEKRKLNLIAITPGTSLDMGHSGGMARERALLFHLVTELWPVDGVGAANLLQGSVEDSEKWRERLREFKARNTLSEALARAFRERLVAEDARAGERGLKTRWYEACGMFARRRDEWPEESKRMRREIVPELRRLLAKSCVGALEPDLVILDEFQRFKSLLDVHAEDETAELARDLFDWSGPNGRARVLLLSATPYKMYTLSHEAGEDDHYQDFLRTIDFLAAGGASVTELRAKLDEYRKLLHELREPGRAERAREVCRSIEGDLRRLMSRTERARSTSANNSMVSGIVPGEVPMEARDVHDFVHLQRLGRHLGQTHVLEYWKSAPYLLSFGHDYALAKAVAREFERDTDAPETEELVGRARRSFLDPAVVARYDAVDPANARLRWLLGDLEAQGLWHCLWLPPSAPSHMLAGEFAIAQGSTKRLVFSAWNVVPRAVTALVSYELERRVFLAEDPGAVNTSESRKARGPLLRTTRTDGRLTGMAVLGWMAPSVRLAELGDPRSAAAELAASGSNGERPSLADVLAHVEQRVRVELAPHIASARRDGPEDEAWYWYAPILLDAHHPATRADAVAWWSGRDLAASWRSAGDDEGDAHGSDVTAGDAWRLHVERAVQALRGELNLARPPADLVAVVARLALAGPGNAALRSVTRLVGGASSVAVRMAAARVGWAFRALFNRPEAIAMVRLTDPQTPYWRLVLEYSCRGALSDVIDEYAHVLQDMEGLRGLEAGAAAERCADAIVAACKVRTSSQEYRSFDEVTGGDDAPHHLRGHIALRFGSDKAEDEPGAKRAESVRAAFNSPFWPFVLVSTSIGQEGLDFHAYCHAVVHWNLPTNPVDLEQREGRVHRFKGHAVRKNVARVHGRSELLEPTDSDPWAGMFERARRACADERGGLVPHWIYECEGGARIERIVPALPLSGDRLRLEALSKSLAVYRLVFGQPRQDDLLAFLTEKIPESVLGPLLQDLRIDLSPPARASATSGDVDSEVSR